MDYAQDNIDSYSYPNGRDKNPLKGDNSVAWVTSEKALKGIGNRPIQDYSDYGIPH